MNYYSIPFLLFFIVVFALHWSLRRWSTLDKLVLLLASYLFYAAWNPLFVVILAGFSLWVFTIGKAISAAASPAHKKGWLGLGVVVAVANLAFFKYYELLRQQSESLASAVGWGLSLPAADILMPVGISFYTFQGLSYLIDRYRGQVDAADAPLDLFLFLAFFPSLLAGPIARAASLLPAIRANGDARIVNMDYALVLIASGLFKKLVVASILAVDAVAPVFGNPAAASSGATLIAIYAYTAQIYCDFSGYTDLTIGIAILLGFRLPPNFNRPYAARNLRDFWQRWHISLSSWIRDYVYIPLGGNRHGGVRTAINVLLAMAISGLWHGASSTYLIWGLLHGLGVVALLVLGWLFAERRLPYGLAWLITLHFVALAWVFFRAASLDDAMTILSHLVYWDGELPTAWASGVLALMVMLLQLDAGRLHGWAVARLRGCALPLKALLLTAWVYVVLLLSPPGVPPFIYFNY